MRKRMEPNSTSEKSLARGGGREGGRPSPDFGVNLGLFEAEAEVVEVVIC